MCIFKHSFKVLVEMDKPSYCLNTASLTIYYPVDSKADSKESPSVPRIAVGILIAILLFAMSSVGSDQVHLFSMIQGQQAFDVKWIHEYYHDMRHASGFPCH